MAKRLAIPSKEVQLKIVGPRDSFLASRVQRLDAGKDVPTTDIDEIGNNQHVGQSRDIPNVTLTFSAMDVGIKIFSALTGTNPASYPGAGVDISSLGEADAILYFKDDQVSDYVKSAHARRLQVRDFTFTYTVDGESTEDYTLIGSKTRWFANDVVVDKFVTGTTSFVLSETPITLKNGDTLLSVVLDGEYLVEVDSAPATGEYSVSGTTITTADTRSNQLLAVYHADPTGSNWSYVSDGSMPAAIRGKDADVVLSANNIPRVQSVTINGTMNVDDVREMGNRAIVGYQRQVPTVEGTITVLDTDTELVDLLSTGDINSGDVEWEIGVDTPVAASGVSLEIQLVDPADSTSPFTILKTVYIPTITIVGDGYTTNVNENAQHVFNFRSEDAQLLIYSGSRT